MLRRINDLKETETFPKLNETSMKLRSLKRHLSASCICRRLIAAIAITCGIWIIFSFQWSPKNGTNDNLTKSQINSLFWSSISTFRSVNEPNIFSDLNETETKLIRKQVLRKFRIENAFQMYKDDVQVKEFNFQVNWNLTETVKKGRKKVKQKIKSYKNNKTLGMRLGQFNTCAIIGNSGILANSGCGEEIDSHDLVIRANMAPIKNFTKDVGVKTSIMTINIEAMQLVLGNITSNKTDSKYWKKEYLDRLRYLNATTLWYFKGTKDNGPLYHKLADTVRNTFKLPIRFAFAPKSMMSPTTRIWNMKFPTSGFVVYTFATGVCDKISIYGFYPSNRDEDNKPVQHHYYEPLIFNYTTDTNHTFTEETKLLQQKKKLHAIRLITNKCSKNRTEEVHTSVSSPLSRN